MSGIIYDYAVCSSNLKTSNWGIVGESWSFCFLFLDVRINKDTNRITCPIQQNLVYWKRVWATSGLAGLPVNLQPSVSGSKSISCWDFQFDQIMGGCGTSRKNNHPHIRRAAPTEVQGFGFIQFWLQFNFGLEDPKLRSSSCRVYFINLYRLTKHTCCMCYCILVHQLYVSSLSCVHLPFVEAPTVAWVRQWMNLGVRHNWAEQFFWISAFWPCLHENIFISERILTCIFTPSNYMKRRSKHILLKAFSKVYLFQSTRFSLVCKWGKHIKSVDHILDKEINLLLNVTVDWEWSK